MKAIRSLLLTLIVGGMPFSWLAILFGLFVSSNTDCVPFSGEANECLSPLAQKLWFFGAILLGGAYQYGAIVALRRLRK